MHLCTLLRAWEIRHSKSEKGFTYIFGVIQDRKQQHLSGKFSIQKSGTLDPHPSTPEGLGVFPALGVSHPQKSRACSSSLGSGEAWRLWGGGGQQHLKRLLQAVSGAHACDVSNRKAEIGGLQIWNQPKLHGKTLSKRRNHFKGFPSRQSEART